MVNGDGLSIKDKKDKSVFYFIQRSVVKVENIVYSHLVKFHGK